MRGKVEREDGGREEREGERRGREKQNNHQINLSELVHCCTSAWTNSSVRE